MPYQDPAVVVASREAPDKVKKRADLVCAGDDDAVTINAAQRLAGAFESRGGSVVGRQQGRVILSGGAFLLRSPILRLTGVALEGQGVLTELRCVGLDDDGGVPGPPAALKLASPGEHLTVDRGFWINGANAAGGSASAVWYQSEHGSGAGLERYPETSPDVDLTIDLPFVSNFHGAPDRHGVVLKDDVRGALVHVAQMRHFTGNGVWTEASGDCKIVRVHLGGAQGNGYLIAGATTQLVACKAYYCDGWGFAFEGREITFASLESQENGGGAWVHYGRVVGSGLIADSCDQYGLLVAASHVQVHGFRVGMRPGFRYPTTDVGLAVEQSQVDVQLFGEIEPADVAAPVVGWHNLGARCFARVSDGTGMWARG